MRLGLVAIAGALTVCAEDPRSVWDGVYTQAQAKRGQAVYGNECASCHGAQLTGGEGAPPLAGTPFTSAWNGLTAGELFARMRESMPFDRPGKLEERQYADVLAYLLSFNRFPAGKSELATRAGELRQIRFQAEKRGE
jgi:mono/diheme cytochrome c family protein